MKSIGVIRPGDKVMALLTQNGDGFMFVPGATEATIPELVAHAKSERLSAEVKARVERSKGDLVAIRWKFHTIPGEMKRIFDIGDFDEDESLKTFIPFKIKKTLLFEWKNKLDRREVWTEPMSSPKNDANAFISKNDGVYSPTDNAVTDKAFRFNPIVASHLSGSDFTNVLESFQGLFCDAVDCFARNKDYTQQHEGSEVKIIRDVSLFDLTCIWMHLAHVVLPQILQAAFDAGEVARPKPIRLSAKLKRNLDAMWPSLSLAAALGIGTMYSSETMKIKQTWIVNSLLRPLKQRLEVLPAWQQHSVGALIAAGAVASIVGTYNRYNAIKEATDVEKHALNDAVRRYVPRVMHTFHKLAKMTEFCVRYMEANLEGTSTTSEASRVFNSLTSEMNALQKAALAQAKRVMHEHITNKLVVYGFRHMLISMHIGETVRMPGITFPLLRVGARMHFEKNSFKLLDEDGTSHAMSTGKAVSDLEPMDVRHVFTHKELGTRTDLKGSRSLVLTPEVFSKLQPVELKQYFGFVDSPKSACDFFHLNSIDEIRLLSSSNHLLRKGVQVFVVQCSPFMTRAVANVQSIALRHPKALIYMCISGDEHIDYHDNTYMKFRCVQYGELVDNEESQRMNSQLQATVVEDLVDEQHFHYLIHKFKFLLLYITASWCQDCEPYEKAFIEITNRHSNLVPVRVVLDRKEDIGPSGYVRRYNQAFITNLLQEKIGIKNPPALVLVNDTAIKMLPMITESNRTSFLLDVSNAVDEAVFATASTPTDLKRALEMPFVLVVVYNELEKSAMDALYTRCASMVPIVRTTANVLRGLVSLGSNTGRQQRMVLLKTPYRELSECGNNIDQIVAELRSDKLRVVREDALSYDA